MYFKKTLLLFLVSINFLSANVNSKTPAQGKTAFWGGIEMVGSVWIANHLYERFLKTDKKMKKLERVLEHRLTIEKEFDYGILSLFSQTTFRGYESSLRAYAQEIKDHQNLQKRQMLKLSLAPLLISCFLTGSSKFLTGISDSL